MLLQLNDEQKDLFKEEDDRLKTLSHLEKVHAELEGTHIEDMVAGNQLNRVYQNAHMQFEVKKQGLETEKVLLGHKIGHLEELVKILKQQVADEDAAGSEIKRVANQDENVNEFNLSDTAKNVRKDNENKVREYNDRVKEWNTEMTNTTKVMRDHDGVVDKYNSTTERFNKMLT